MTVLMEKLKNIDLDKLYHFYLIFRERSIKKVTDDYNISTSILRHSLLTLEKKLDLKLYHPSKKSFVPTEDGEKLFLLCKNIVEAVNTYQSDINKNNKKGEKQDLIILATTTLANYFLPSILKQFDKYYPDVQIQVLCGPEYFLDISKYAFDVILGPKMNNTNLVTKKLGNCVYKFYCSSSIKESLKFVKSPSDLQGQNLLLFSGQHFLSKDIIKKNKIKATSNSYPFLLHLCSQGQGILSCFNSKVFKSLNIDIHIEEIFSDYIAEEEYAYFFYNRFTDKLEMIEKLFHISKIHMNEMAE